MVMLWNGANPFKRDPEMVKRILAERKKQKYERMFEENKTGFYTLCLQEIAEFTMMDPTGNKRMFPMDTYLFPWLLIKGNPKKYKPEQVVSRVEKFLREETILLSRNFRDVVPGNMEALRDRVFRWVYRTNMEGKARISYRAYIDLLNLFFHTIDSTVLKKTRDLDIKYPDDKSTFNARKKRDIRTSIKQEMVFNFLTELCPGVGAFMAADTKDHQYYFVRKFYTQDKFYGDEEILTNQYFLKVYFLADSQSVYDYMRKIKVPNSHQTIRNFIYLDMLNNKRTLVEKDEFINQMYIWETLSGPNPKKVNSKVKRVMDLSPTSPV